MDPTANVQQMPPQIPGLAGNLATPPPQPDQSQDSQPVVPGPATEGPANPSQSIARHILDALGGSGGKPMDWARGIVAGGLAAAANVGKAPEGAGGLYGAAKGAQGLL